MDRPIVWVCATLAAIHAWNLFSPEIRLFLWPDSVVYLLPAADAFEFGRFSHVGSRAFVYPGFLWVVLRLWDEPSAIVTAQRVIAFATFLCLAGVMAVVIRGMRNPAGMGSRGVALIAGFWLAVFVLYPPAAGLTHMVAPETLATFLFSITLAGIVLIGSPHLAFASRLAMTAVTVLTSVMLALLRPHWQLAALLLPWLLPFLAPWGQRKAVTVCTAVAVAASVVVLLVPEWALQRRYDAYLSGVFGPRVLFCSSADLVHPYLVRADDDEFSVRVRDSLGQLLTVEARARATDWALLGFNSDLCTYGGTARIVADRFANAPGEETRYYLTTYLHALTADPLYLPARLGRNFVAVASRPFPAVATDYWVRYDDHVLLENADSRALFRNWADRHRPLFSGDIDLPSRRWLLGSRMFFAGAGLLMSLMTLAAAISLPVFQRRGHASALARPFAVTLVCSLAANALIAVVHTFEPRYLVMQAPMFVMLGFLATTAVIDSATKTWHRTSARW